MAIAKNSKLTKNPPKKPQSSVLKRAMKLTLDQFLERTPIHGMKHILDPRGNFYTKFTWIFIIFICFASAGALMATFLVRYKSNPTRINIETNFGKIHEIEFPAVTFCNPNFITDSMVDKLIKSLETFEDGTTYNNLTKESLAYRVKLLAGFTNSINSFDPIYLNDLSDVLLDNRFDVKLTMKKLMYPCTSLLYRCRWEGKITDCKDLFQISETYQGYCCSFNIKKPKKAVSNSAKKENPRKTQFSGPDRGLSVILKPLIEKNSMATVNSEGIKILINEFDLFPSEKTIERMLPLQQETFVEIRPVTTISSKAISALPISDRGCVFEEEYQLRVFPEYKERNCQVECTMQKTYELCQCLPYFYYNTENLETCDVLKLPCIVTNQEVLKKTKAPQNESKETCNCPPQCDSTSYEIRMSSTNIELEMGKFNIDPFNYNLTSEHMIVHVYFVSQFYRIFIRSLLTNFISLISNLGGVYALLIGMSILSTIEIFYFPTVRLYMNYKKIKEEDLKPKTFSQRLEKVNISVMKVPRLDTAKSDMSEISGFSDYHQRMHSSHFHF